MPPLVPVVPQAGIARAIDATLTSRNVALSGLEYVAQVPGYPEGMSGAAGHVVTTAVRTTSTCNRFFRASAGAYSWTSPNTPMPQPGPRLRGDDGRKQDVSVCDEPHAAPLATPELCTSSCAHLCGHHMRSLFASAGEDRDGRVLTQRRPDHGP
jgi:hypothetical protein